MIRMQDQTANIETSSKCREMCTFFLKTNGEIKSVFWIYFAAPMPRGNASEVQILI